jgi:hypothetical protein
MIHTTMRLNKDNMMHLIQTHISIDSAVRKHKTQLHIAVLIKRGRILTIATNSVGSRSRGCGYESRTIHAERAVIKKCGNMADLAGTTLVVVRIAKGTHEIVNSEPCHSCRCHLEKCIKDYGLKSVYYSV